MKLGAEPKKVFGLGALLLLAAVIFYFNMSGSGSGSASVPIRAAVPSPSANATPPTARAERRQASGRNAPGEFKPRLGPRDPREKPDPSTIDPTLRLDLLAKVQSVQTGPEGRNIFQTGAAPEVNLKPLPTVAKIETKNVPPPPPPPPAGPPPPPVAPPMTFKYYGYKIANGHKAAFLLDGEEIFIANENETMKRRYKVVKIGVNSITIEDTQFKSQQTLPLQENLAG